MCLMSAPCFGTGLRIFERDVFICRKREQHLRRDAQAQLLGQGPNPVLVNPFLVNPFLVKCRKREQQLRRDAQAQLQELQRKRGRDRGRKVLKLSSEHLEAEMENEPEEEPADGTSTEPLDLRSLELKLTVDLEALAEATGRNLGRNDINLLKVFVSSSLSYCFLSRLAVAISSQKPITFTSEPVVSSWKRLHWRRFVLNVLQMGPGFCGSSVQC
jgi:hypothetical protein